jgi:hypothetical protein
LVTGGRKPKEKGAAASEEVAMTIDVSVRIFRLRIPYRNYGITRNYGVTRMPLSAVLGWGGE